MLNLKDDEVKLEVYRLRENEDLSITEIHNATGIPKTTISDFINKRTHKEWWEKVDEKPIASGTLKSPETRRENLYGKRFVMTCAQNNTYAWREFLDSLKVYCNAEEGRLLIGGCTYNKKGFQNSVKDGEEWYDPEVVPYIVNSPTLLNERFLFCGELNILPTAVDPINTLQTYTKGYSGCVPHTKLRFKSCPRDKHKEPKYMMTTGAVTQSNYVGKLAGQKSEFHHTYSAVVIEFDSQGQWWTRFLSADDSGGFYDLNKYYSPEGVEEAEDSVCAVTYGDLHSEKPDLEVYDGMFGDHENSLLNTLKPEYQFCQDTLDFTTRNHHNIKDKFFRAMSQVKGPDTVQEDVNKAANVLKRMDRPYCKTIVVESNHDQAYKKWLGGPEPLGDNLTNLLTYYRGNVLIYESIERGEFDFSIFEHEVLQRHPDLNIKFLKVDESFVICEEYGGIENTNHGHYGVNGARGSVVGLSKLDSKQNMGHVHSPEVKDGVFAAGISGNPEQGYNKGPTSWGAAHILTYKNSRRTLILSRGKDWKAFD